MRGPGPARLGAALLLLAAAAAAEPGVTLVDGTGIDGAVLLGGDANTLRFRVGDDEREVPTRSVVSITLPPPAAEFVAAGTPNLYLHDGDELSGTVGGDDDGVRLDSAAVTGLRVPLERVRAIRSGRIPAMHLQDKYEEAFERDLEKGRDSVLAIRDDRPTPIAARVLAMTPGTLTVRLGAREQELPVTRIYGFVRARLADPEPPAPGLRMRLHLAGGGRLTLPAGRITADTIEGGGTTVARAAVERITLLGDHLAHLSAFEPIDVEQRALFGEPRPWRRDRMVLGGPLALGGRTYAHGLGTHAYTRLEYILGARWDRLFLRCGIDDAAGREGEATFRILGDGEVLHEARLRRGDPPQPVRLDVTGVDRLVLEAVPNGSYVSDLCDWVDARVFRTPRRDGGEEAE